MSDSTFPDVRRPALHRLHEFLARRSAAAPDTPLHQTESLAVRGDLDAARAVARTAMRCVGAPAEERREAGRVVLEGRTGWTWDSFGEIVRIELTRTDRGVSVRLSSRPWVASTDVDYGKNLENVRVLRAAMAGGLPADAPSAAP